MFRVLFLWLMVGMFYGCSAYDLYIGRMDNLIMKARKERMVLIKSMEKEKAEERKLEKEKRRKEAEARRKQMRIIKEIERVRAEARRKEKEKRRKEAEKNRTNYSLFSYIYYYFKYY